MTVRRNSKRTCGIGREIFLAQLGLMKECGKVAEFLDESGDQKLQPAVQAYPVPEELAEAFYAYHMEFLSQPGGCTNINGPFFNDEDVKAGVWSKYYHFYKPIVNLVEAKYPNLWFSVNIAPSSDDATGIIVVVENRCGYDAIPVPVACLNEYWKAWHIPFDEPENPEAVYSELEEIYNRMDDRVRRAISRPYVIVQLEGGVLADTWICHDEIQAVALAGKIAGERCRDGGDDVLVELPASPDDIHGHSARVWLWGGGKGDITTNHD